MMVQLIYLPDEGAVLNFVLRHFRAAGQSAGIIAEGIEERLRLLLLLRREQAPLPCSSSLAPPKL